MKHAFSISALCVALLGGGCQRPEATQGQFVPGGDAQRGKHLIRAYGCGSCHTIPGVRGAHGLVAPPLTAFKQRAYIAGRLPNTGDNLIMWIVNPAAVDSLTAMPVLGVSGSEARHIAAYLYELERGGLGPPHLLPQRWLHALGNLGF